MPRPSGAAPPALLVLAVLVAGCGGASATSSEPLPSPTSPPTPSIAPTVPQSTATPSTSAPITPSEPPTPEATMAPFTLSSTSFEAGGSIPRRFTCDGNDVSPELEWSGVPDGAGALVLVVDDPDAGGFTHWLVLDLTASESGALPVGISASPDAPPQGTNDFRRLGWAGPCPPSGEHRYVFTLYALAEPLGLTGAPRGGEVRAALGSASVLDKAVLEARYRRQR